MIRLKTIDNWVIDKRTARRLSILLSIDEHDRGFYSRDHLNKLCGQRNSEFGRMLHRCFNRIKATSATKLGSGPRFVPDIHKFCRLREVYQSYIDSHTSTHSDIIIPLGAE